jgi:hypothetical protein
VDKPERTSERSPGNAGGFTLGLVGDPGDSPGTGRRGGLGTPLTEVLDRTDLGGRLHGTVFDGPSLAEDEGDEGDDEAPATFDRLEELLATAMPDSLIVVRCSGDDGSARVALRGPHQLVQEAGSDLLRTVETFAPVPGLHLFRPDHQQIVWISREGAVRIGAHRERPFDPAEVRLVSAIASLAHGGLAAVDAPTAVASAARRVTSPIPARATAAVTETQVAEERVALERIVVSTTERELTCTVVLRGHRGQEVEGSVTGPAMASAGARTVAAATLDAVRLLHPGLEAHLEDASTATVGANDVAIVTVVLTTFGSDKLCAGAAAVGARGRDDAVVRATLDALNRWLAQL